MMNEITLPFRLVSSDIACYAALLCFEVTAGLSRHVRVSALSPISSPRSCLHQRTSPSRSRKATAAPSLSASGCSESGPRSLSTIAFRLIKVVWRSWVPMIQTNSGAHWSRKPTPSEPFLRNSREGNCHRILCGREEHCTDGRVCWKMAEDERSLAIQFNSIQLFNFCSGLCCKYGYC